MALQYQDRRKVDRRKVDLFLFREEEMERGIITSSEKLNNLLKNTLLERVSWAQGVFFDFSFTTFSLSIREALMILKKQV